MHLQLYQGEISGDTFEKAFDQGDGARMPQKRTRCQPDLEHGELVSGFVLEANELVAGGENMQSFDPGCNTFVAPTFVQLCQHMDKPLGVEVRAESLGPDVRCLCKTLEKQLRPERRNTERFGDPCPP